MTTGRVLASAGEQSTNAFLSADDAGLIREWDERAVSMFGWSAAEALARPLGDVLVPVDSAVDRSRPGRWLATDPPTSTPSFAT